MQTNTLCQSNATLLCLAVHVPQFDDIYSQRSCFLWIHYPHLHTWCHWGKCILLTPSHTSSFIGLKWQRAASRVIHTVICCFSVQRGQHPVARSARNYWGCCPRYVWFPCEREYQMYLFVHVWLLWQNNHSLIIQLVINVKVCLYISSCDWDSKDSFSSEKTASSQVVLVLTRWLFL